MYVFVCIEIRYLILIAKWIINRFRVCTKIDYFHERKNIKKKVNIEWERPNSESRKKKKESERKTHQAFVMYILSSNEKLSFSQTDI